MTYCVGLRMNAGLVFLSDTRTNAGVDNISTFPKMNTWHIPGERMVTVLSAGNLATTQAVVSILDERVRCSGGTRPSIMEASSMFQIANMVGETLQSVIQQSAARSNLVASAFGATMIVGGQIIGSEPRVFLIYPEGNFIETSDDTPFFQIGETKYGRPMLVRAFDAHMSFEEAVKLLLVSFDSTVKANLSVGLPLDMQVYEADSFAIGRKFRMTQDDPYYQEISSGWGNSLRQAFADLTPFTFDKVQV